MVERVKRLLLYAGVDKEEFQKLQPMFMESNRQNIERYSIIVVAIFAFMFVSTFFVNGLFLNNSILYIVTMMVSLVIFVLAKFLKAKAADSMAMSFLVTYLFMILLYVEAIRVSTIHPDLLAVTFIGILLVVPHLFADRPLNMIMLQLVMAILFCFVVTRFKYPEVAYVDCINTSMFFLVSIIAVLITVPLRIKNLSHTAQILYLSENDLLTGLHNRNCYENHLKDYEEQLSKGLICVFADANGLHHLNDTQGHAAGDLMLQTIANEIKKAFGLTDSYRIGGDEFVIFTVSDSMEEVENKVSEITTACKTAGYSVSFGIAQANEKTSKIQVLIDAAEHLMYDWKEIFYKNPENNRRK